MRILYIFVLLLGMMETALAVEPNPESFVVAGIHLGDTFDQVQKIAKDLNLRLMNSGFYEVSGGYPRTVAYQEFGKECPHCTIPRDPKFESLIIQYSRINKKVVAISRTLPFYTTTYEREVLQTISERFGKESSGSSKGIVLYAWKANGQLEDINNKKSHCRAPVVMPITTWSSNPNCGLAATFSFERSQDYPNVVISQKLIVMDWATFDDEMGLAEQSEIRRRDTEQEITNGMLHRNAQGGIPRL